MPNNQPSAFRSDDANPGNTGHRFVKPEIDLTKSPETRNEQPSIAEMQAWINGTPRYKPEP